MSQILLLNSTNETIRLAVFQTPVCNPALATIAWQIAAPPPGGTTYIAVPEDFSLQARYASDPNHPTHLDTEIAPAAFAEATAAFTIDAAVSQERGPHAVINRTFNDLVLDEVRVSNNFSTGVEASILRGTEPVFQPQVIWPGGLFAEAARSSLYVAVVSPFTYKGQRLVQEEISLTQIEVLEGDSVAVSGSRWRGYALSKV